MAASDVSAIPGVRAFLLGLQQEMAKKQSLIMDGRDIGTVVIPDAELKIFLTASNESRAKRRHLEYIQKGQEVTYEEILQDILRRDQQDSSRAAAPLRKADDAVLIDSTNLTFEQTVDAIKKLIVQRGRRAFPVDLIHAERKKYIVLSDRNPRRQSAVALLVQAADLRPGK